MVLQIAFSMGSMALLIGSFKINALHAMLLFGEAICEIYLQHIAS